MTLQSDFAYVADKGVRHALERYATPFLTQLGRGIGTFPHAIQALEVHPGEGVFAFAMLNGLPAGSRLMAVGHELESLEVLHAQRARALGPLARQFFPRRDDLTRLPFAPAVFDVVYSCGAFEPLTDPKIFLPMALRLLRPGGRVVLVQPLRNSFLELTQATAATLPSTDTEALTRLLTERPILPALEELQAEAERAGAIVVDAWEERLQLEIEPKDPLVTRLLVPLYLGDPAKLTIATPLWLSQVVKQAMSTTVYIGGLTLRRSHVPLEMD